jgi:ribonuclease-3
MNRRAGLDLGPLERKLGHAFADRGLLLEALTHQSAITEGRLAGPNYQRLEFLGDRVLALVVAEMLIDAFPSAPEGTLTRRLNQLVRAETCAEVARELGLGAHLVLGEGEIQSGGRERAPILGDACEGVIGAIFRDAGFEAARRFVRAWWEPRMRSAAKADLRDPKTRLQEWAQGRGLDAPTYSVVERRGLAHAPVFLVAVEVQGVGSARGEGASKRAAEQAAAEALYARRARREENA